MSLLAWFAKKWSHADYPPDRVSEIDLNGAEKELSCVFPDNYRDEVLTTGLPRPSIALLHSIVEGNRDLRDVSDFLEPNLVVEQTRTWWEMGLPSDMVAFATDCMGNMFAFRIGDRDGAVWFFDHDDAVVELEAHSFSGWIQSFIDLPFISPDD